MRINITFPFLGIDINNFGYILGYLVISFTFIYYCFGNIFLLTRKKLFTRYPCGGIEFRYKLSKDRCFVKRLECCFLDYSDAWYELDMRMFGFIGSDMDISYYNSKILSISNIEELFEESDRVLSLKRNRSRYENDKSDKNQIRLALSFYYILFSVIYFILIYR